MHHDGSKYDGYRLTNMGYDFLALRALMARGSIAAVGSQIGVGKESDVFEVGSRTRVKLLCEYWKRLRHGRRVLSAGFRRVDKGTRTIFMAGLCRVCAAFGHIPSARELVAEQKRTKLWCTGRLRKMHHPGHLYL